MARTFSAEVRGLDRTLKRFRSLGLELPRALGAALYREAEVVIGRAKERAPVDMGVLRDSLHADLPKYEGGDVVVVMGAGGPAAPYALYVHEGTGPAVGRPGYWIPPGVLLPWLRRHGISEDAEFVIRRAVFLHGTKPTKYLEAPLKERVPGLSSRLAQAVRAEARARG